MKNERYGLTTEAEYYDFFDSSICDGKVVLERIGPKSVRQREILYFASQFIPLGGAGSPHNKLFWLFSPIFQFLLYGYDTQLVTRTYFKWKVTNVCERLRICISWHSKSSAGNPHKMQFCNFKSLRPCMLLIENGDIIILNWSVLSVVVRFNGTEFGTDLGVCYCVS